MMRKKLGKNKSKKKEEANKKQKKWHKQVIIPHEIGD